MRIILLGIFLLTGIAALTLIPSKNLDKINGVSLVSPPREIDSETMGEVKRINAGWVAIIPYGFSRSGEASVSFNHGKQWWGEKRRGTAKLIEYAKVNGINVMLKPHVWVRGEGWTGDFNLDSEEKWQQWENDFSEYILNYASVADSMNVEIFCVGTEYRIPARERPEFWRGLIAKVRKVYSGKITYAANWDNYENIIWWDKVDYIGIDAYFPLVEGANPSVEEIKDGWTPIKRNLSAFSKKWDKLILFTEYGFQSANGATWNHWEIDQNDFENTNQELQSKAYEATFQALANEDWYKGGFLWKWHFNLNHDRVRPTSWTPQNKKAEEVIAKWYSKIQ